MFVSRLSFPCNIGISPGNNDIRIHPDVDL